MKAFDLIMSNPDIGACSDLRNFATASFLLKFKPMSQWGSISVTVRIR